MKNKITVGKDSKGPTFVTYFWWNATPNIIKGTVYHVQSGDSIFFNSQKDLDKFYLSKRNEQTNE